MEAVAHGAEVLVKTRFETTGIGVAAVVLPWGGTYAGWLLQLLGVTQVETGWYGVLYIHRVQPLSVHNVRC